MIKKAYEKLKRETNSLNILCGVEGVCEIARLEEADIVLSAIVGAEGLLPTFEAVKAGKVIALANKESLVMAGDLIKNRQTSAKLR